jgi:hypothetical protein
MHISIEGVVSLGAKDVFGATSDSRGNPLAQVSSKR